MKRQIYKQWGGTCPNLPHPAPWPPPWLAEEAGERPAVALTPVHALVGPAVGPPVAVAVPVVAPDDCPTWEQAEPPGPPCPTCSGLAYWLDLRGGRHCQNCEAGKLARAVRLLATAVRIRARKRPAAGAVPTSNQTADPANPEQDADSGPAVALSVAPAGKKRPKRKESQQADKRAEMDGFSR